MGEDMRWTVTSGEPDELELAAVTAVLLARLRRLAEESDAEPDAEAAGPEERANWRTEPAGYRSAVTWTRP
ncbi:acyl-CoA carboxylase epsilon subunit [Streptomyces sp. H27-D2]|uniref:acyl-CoA carboxylase epsilon subunit n=1 Tax=Streptomyces sp. H27-D2 TaxID=3046304 RepID=UPI002DBFBA49|nr:acyl-CoA carboxylase epsilon subunit [Streptomyces sp. H27-D2]MEC4017650.1 acyl-CoA carboxylase epsilon subunit [Streptomyces sp. H27-D2]